jgi:hypothetical protein
MWTPDEAFLFANKKPMGTGQFLAFLPSLRHAGRGSPLYLQEQAMDVFFLVSFVFLLIFAAIERRRERRKRSGGFPYSRNKKRERSKKW